MFTLFLTNIMDFSTKSLARNERTTSYRLYKLTYSSPLPSQSSILNVHQNKKKQLIEIIVKSLADKIDISGDVGVKLIVNGHNPTPMEISAGGLVIFRHDLQNFHEEEDEIIVAHVIYAATVESKHVQVVADDTDIYIMLLYHYYTNSIETPMTISPTRCGRTVIDIKATVEQLGEMCLDILPAHALTGCDQVPVLHGIGTLTMLKTLKEHKQFNWRFVC